MLDDRLASLEKKMHRYDIWFGVAITVAIFFGLTGGVGWTLLTTAQNELADLSERIEALDEMSNLALEQLAGVDQTTGAAIDQIRKSQDEAENQIRDQAARLAQEISRTEIAPLVTEFLSSTNATIRASELIIVNGDGKEVLGLVADRNGAGYIWIKNNQEREIVNIGAYIDDKSGFIRLNSPEGVMRVDIDSTPRIKFYNKSAEDLLFEVYETEFGGNLVLYNATGSKRIRARVNQDDVGEVDKYRSRRN